MVPGVVTGAQIAAALQGRFSKGTLGMTILICPVLCCTVLYRSASQCGMSYIDVRDTRKKFLPLVNRSK